MEKSAQIFISGTYEDLKEERHTVINNLNKLDNAKPVTMEYTGSNPESTLASSLKLIEKSDIFICIIAHRYGNVPGGHEKSITELEYMKASELKIPILIYITAISKEDTKYKNVEQDHTKMKKLDDFKNYLNELHTITTYSSPDDLASKVILDIKNQKLIQFVLDKSKSDFRFKEETDIIYIYRTFLAQQYRSITIFRDKSFELKDIYITLSLELNPMIWHGMGETEFIRMKKDGELPERYLEVMEMTASVHKSRVDKNLYKGSHDNELSIDDVLKASNRAVILGEAGSGKTTLFHHLIATYRDDGKKYIPVFLPIRYWLNCELCDPLDAFCKMLKEKYYKFPSNYTNALNKKLV